MRSRYIYYMIRTYGNSNNGDGSSRYHRRYSRKKVTDYEVKNLFVNSYD